MTSPNSQDVADYSVWNLCYAKADMPKDFFGGAGIMSNQGVETISMNFTLIKGGFPGEEHLYLIDCGFHAPVWFERYPFYDWEDPKTVLAKVGVSPEDIEAIFVTHMHFDHINQMDAFPNARIFLQRKEYNGWAMATNLPSRYKPGDVPWIYSSFELHDMLAMQQARSDGRVTLLDGVCEVAPGIISQLAENCHTFGSCLWHITTCNGLFIAAGDTVYWYANMEDMWPPGYGQGDTFALFLLFDSIKQSVGGDLSRIIPGHDHKIYEKHPAWTAGKNPVAEINLSADQKSLKPKE